MAIEAHDVDLKASFEKFVSWHSVIYGGENASGAYRSTVERCWNQL